MLVSPGLFFGGLAYGIDISPAHVEKSEFFRHDGADMFMQSTYEKDA